MVNFVLATVDPYIPNKLPICPCVGKTLISMRDKKIEQIDFSRRINVRTENQVYVDSNLF